MTSPAMNPHQRRVDPRRAGSPQSDPAIVHAPGTYARWARWLVPAVLALAVMPAHGAVDQVDGERGSRGSSTAHCLAEDRATCIREERAAAQAQARGDLTDPLDSRLSGRTGTADSGPSPAPGASGRCDVHRGEARHRCMARLAIGERSGSVAEGGRIVELRETVEPSR